MNGRQRSVAWEQILPPATLLLVSLIVAGPLWGPGLLNTRGGGDSPFLLLRTHQLATNLRAGVFPARWMPDAAYGLGYPFFSYYAALPYYLAAGFTLIGLDVLTAIKLTQTLFFGAAALGMYRWAEETLRSRPAAWLAAVAYTVAPFHLVNVYVRGDSLSEFAAFAFYPLVLWGLDRLTSDLSWRRVLFPALAYAGLILTHNASALMFSPFIVLYMGFHVVGSAGHGTRPAFRRGVSLLPRFIAVLLLALLLSAWFWLPALAETQYVQLEAQTTGYFFYGNHFRGSDLVQYHPFFDYSTAADHPSPFAMGALQAALALTSIIVAIVRRMRPHRKDRDRPRTSRVIQPKTRRFGAGTFGLGFAVLGLLLSTWLITPLSWPLWEHVPLLPMVQFPWRFLSVQALFAALLAGGLVMPFHNVPRSASGQAHVRPIRRRWRFFVAWGCAIALGALLSTTALIGLRPEYLPIRADEVTAERLQLYELFTGNVGSTIRHEYLPRWVKPRLYTGPSLVTPDVSPRAMLVRGELLGAERLERRPTCRVWRVEAGAAGLEVAFPLNYWPGWQATVDGSPVEVGPAPGSGYLSMKVAPGTHTVEIRLGRTALRLGAELASLATTLTGLALWMAARRRGGRALQSQVDGDKGNGGRGPGSRHPQPAITCLPFVAVLALLTAFHPRGATGSSRDLTMDFGNMPYLHHNPDGVSFDDWRVLGYTYSAETIAPGEALRVTLDWERGEEALADSPLDERAALRLVSPAAIRQDAIPAVAETAINLDRDPGTGAGRATLDLSVPRDAAPGIYFPQIASLQRTYLQPVWIASLEREAGAPTRATFADGKVRLHTVDVTQPAPDRLDVQLGWSATESLAANYGLSLSLRDTAGNEWLRGGYDTQPGQGFLPTSLWPTGRLIADRHVPALEPGAPPGERYTLTVDLYRVATWESVGAITTTVSLTQVLQRPDAPVVGRLGDEIALSRLETPSGVGQGEVLRVTAYWLTLKRPRRDDVVEWRLETPGQGITAYAGTQPLAPGSAPTDWPSAAWIAGRAALSVPPTALPGEYTLSLTLRDPASGAALGTYTHPETVRVQERERVWELPAMGQRSGAQFGGTIELVGYDVAQDRVGLELTLHWRALSTPDRHYMFFVHLAEPDTGRPMEQVDTMPRGFTYPTGMWAPGEIVSDEVSLSLGDLESGRYDLALGWYDPDTRQRLAAVDAGGNRLPDDRLLLPGGVTVR